MKYTELHNSGLWVWLCAPPGFYKTILSPLSDLKLKVKLVKPSYVTSGIYQPTCPERPSSFIFRISSWLSFWFSPEATRSLLSFPDPAVKFKHSHGNTTVTTLVQQYVLKPLSLKWQFLCDTHRFWCLWDFSCFYLWMTFYQDVYLLLL